MAAARSYRDDLQCPHCGSNWLPKDGRPPGASKPTAVRLCHYRFTPDGNRHYYSEKVKEQAIDMYGEGMAIAAISRGSGGQAGDGVRVGQKKSGGQSGDLGLGDHATPAVGHGSSHIF